MSPRYSTLATRKPPMTKPLLDGSPAELHPSSRDALRVVQLARHGRRVVFVSGNFNIVHPGHLRLLRFAKECGDYLLVGVNDARSGGAFLDEQDRLEGVRAIAWVDHAFVLHDLPAAIIRALRPEVVVKGREHEQAVNPEAEAVASYGGRLRFGSGDVSFSSTDLLRREREVNVSAIQRPADYLSRHGISPDHALEVLERMKTLRVCVIGDTIVDEYVTCDPLGMSQEDPTIVVTPVLTERFVGGAGIVAAHARSLGAKVQFHSAIGDDETADFVRRNMAEFGVDLHAHVDESRPTTLKQRYRAGGKTLLRVSHLRQHDIGAALRDRVRAEVEAALDDLDLVVFSDFNYGCLPRALIDPLTEGCRARGIMMAADSQCSSQIGDVSRFRDMTLLTPTEREARLALQDFESGLVVLAEKLRARARAENVVITMGAEGLLVQASQQGAGGLPTDRIPALNLVPRDPAGAGDSFLTCAAMALASGADVWLASYVGSVAAACQVGRVGNVPLTPDELAREIAR